MSLKTLKASDWIAMFALIVSGGSVWFSYKQFQETQAQSALAVKVEARQSAEFSNADLIRRLEHLSTQCGLYISAVGHHAGDTSVGEKDYRVYYETVRDASYLIQPAEMGEPLRKSVVTLSGHPYGPRAVIEDDCNAIMTAVITRKKEVRSLKQ